LVLVLPVFAFAVLVLPPVPDGVFPAGLLLAGLLPEGVFDGAGVGVELALFAAGVPVFEGFAGPLPATTPCVGPKVRLPILT
jgi:hypothetical protein